MKSSPDRSDLCHLIHVCALTVLSVVPVDMQRESKDMVVLDKAVHARSILIYIYVQCRSHLLPSLLSVPDATWTEQLGEASKHQEHPLNEVAHLFKLARVCQCSVSIAGEDTTSESLSYCTVPSTRRSQWSTGRSLTRRYTHILRREIDIDGVVVRVQHRVEVCKVEC